MNSYLSSAVSQGNVLKTATKSEMTIRCQLNKSTTAIIKFQVNDESTGCQLCKYAFGERLKLNTGTSILHLFIVT